MAFESWNWWDIQGISCLICGVVITAAAIYTLVAIHRRKSLRQLRTMTIFILVIGVIRILEGSVLYFFFSEYEEGLDLGLKLFLSETGSSLDDYAVFLLVWFVSLKFWKIVRQLTIYLGSNSATTNSIKENLQALHERYEKL